VHQAGLDVDDTMVVKRFARGLPCAMYDFIYTHKKPQTYEQWQHKVFDSQNTFVHLRNHINDFRSNAPRPQGNWRGVVQANQDPNAMDTSHGSVADDSSLHQAIKLKTKRNKRARQDRQPSLMWRQVMCLHFKTIAECLKPLYLYTR
jgi:hypothetical protein